jgi:hypothetical protein
MDVDIQARLELFKRRHGHEYDPCNRWDDEDMFDQVMDEWDDFERSSQSSQSSTQYVRAAHLYVFYHAPTPEQYNLSDRRRRWTM